MPYCQLREHIAIPVYSSAVADGLSYLSGLIASDSHACRAALARPSHPKLTALRFVPVAGLRVSRAFDRASPPAHSDAMLIVRCHTTA